MRKMELKTESVEPDSRAGRCRITVNDIFGRVRILPGELVTLQEDFPVI